MILFKNSVDLHTYLDKQREKGRIAGFVPTMGALHEGHVSLIERAAAETDSCVASIFVNPTQFNDPADFKKYPVTLESDIRLLEKAGCQVLFLPSVDEIYPEGTDLQQRYELGYLETILEGKYRPGHFQGVCNVVHRLLKIVQPDHLYIGQKDYQQCMVIQKLLELTGMDNSIAVHVSPTLREPHGLAMSSRNMRLSNEARAKAGAIYATIAELRDSISSGDLRSLREAAVNRLSDLGFRVDYIEMATADTLSLRDEWNGRERLVILAAAFIDDVRLIDNVLTER